MSVFSLMIFDGIYLNTGKLLVQLQSVAKYFTKTKKIKQNWTRPENFDISFCVSSGHFCQGLTFGGDTGHKTVFPSNFQIFFSFPDFLRSFGNL